MAAIGGDCENNTCIGTLINAIIEQRFARRRALYDTRMAAPQRQPSSGLTRKSKKDDVEALLSDFDILDDNGRSISTSQASATSPGPGSGASSRDAALSGSQTSDRSAAHAARTGAPRDEASTLLADLDDLVKQRRSATPKGRPSQPNTPTMTGGPTRVRYTSGLTSSRTATPGTTSGTRTPEVPLSTDMGLAAAALPGVPDSATASAAAPTSNTSPKQEPAPSWGSWWSSATRLADQARAELEKRAVQVQAQVAERAREASTAAQGAQARGEDVSGADGSNAQGKPWMLAQNVNTFLKSHAGDLNKLRADLSKVGQRGWNEILHVVAPPIESHEVLSITLSHDMVAFDGVQEVVFQVLQRVMETHASSENAEHQLIVNSAPQQQAAKPKTSAEDLQQELKPDMRPVPGFDQGWKLAHSSLEDLIRSHQSGGGDASAQGSRQSQESASLPITKCPLYIRIQPVLAPLPGTGEAHNTNIFVLILLRDTANNLTHRTVSQPIPEKYATLPFEEQPWAEDLLSESLQAALSSVGIDYIRTRMQARTEALAQAADAVRTEEVESQEIPQTAPGA